MHLSIGFSCGVGTCYLVNKFKPRPQYELLAVDEHTQKLTVQQNYQWYYEYGLHKDTIPKLLKADYITQKIDSQI
jgi:hypothetical protein